MNTNHNGNIDVDRSDAIDPNNSCSAKSVSLVSDMNVKSLISSNGFFIVFCISRCLCPFDFFGFTCESVMSRHSATNSPEHSVMISEFTGSQGTKQFTAMSTFTESNIMTIPEYTESIEKRNSAMPEYVEATNLELSTPTPNNHESVTKHMVITPQSTKLENKKKTAATYTTNPIAQKTQVANHVDLITLHAATTQGDIESYKTEYTATIREEFGSKNAEQTTLVPSNTELITEPVTVVPYYSPKNIMTQPVTTSGLIELTDQSYIVPTVDVIESTTKQSTMTWDYAESEYTEKMTTQNSTEPMAKQTAISSHSTESKARQQPTAFSRYSKSNNSTQLARTSYYYKPVVTKLLTTASEQSVTEPHTAKQITTILNNTELNALKETAEFFSSAELLADEKNANVKCKLVFFFTHYFYYPLYAIFFALWL